MEKEKHSNRLLDEIFDRDDLEKDEKQANPFVQD